MGNRKRVHVLISGRVQGVYYRASAKDAAMQIRGLSGWVRNLPDGRVELEVEGLEEKVDALLEWCKTGPPYSRVDRVITDEKTPFDDTGNFEIIY